jgi:2'-hydroxyisoflavone reductase
MCGYLPQWVESSTNALKNSIGKYVFISSISAYDESAKPNFNETAKLARLTPEQEHKFAKIDPNSDFNAADLGDMYGALTVLCEEEVQKTFPENNLIIRPGLIVGKYDWTDRFTYWVMRVERGGEVFSPNDPNAFVQFIDAKDLMEWLVKMIENDEKGIYNAVNKPFEITFGNLLETIKNVSESDAEFTWVSEEFMQENEVAPWSDMPLHLPESLQFMETANIDKALEKGLKFRALNETVSDTLNWRKTVDDELKAGISAEREKELLEKWHEQNS